MNSVKGGKFGAAGDRIDSARAGDAQTGRLCGNGHGVFNGGAAGQLSQKESGIGVSRAGGVDGIDLVGRVKMARISARKAGTF